MDEIKTATTVAVSFFGILSLFFVIKKLRNDKKSEKWVHVGHLDEILIHPIKGRVHTVVEFWVQHLTKSTVLCD